MTPRDVTFVLFEGFTASDITGPADVFTAATQFGRQGGYRLHYVAPAARVVAKSGATFLATPLAEAPPDRPGTLLIAGADREPLRGALGDPRLMGWIAAAAGTASRVCAVCSGAFILAALGLLDGRRATTHWRALDDLARFRGEVRLDHRALFVEDGTFWTSAGVTAGTDMALAMVERDLGHGVAMATARELVLFLVRGGGQPQFSAPLALQTRAAATDLRDLPAWIEERLDGPCAIDAMAAAMGMGERTLHRRCQALFGCTPMQLVHRLRLERARSLLEDPAQPIKAVASRCGFAGPELLGRHFRAAFGVPPGAYRQRFARRGFGPG